MITTSDLFNIGSGIKRICEENRIYLEALVSRDKEIERLREALQEILKTNHMDYVLMKEIARAALKEEK